MITGNPRQDSSRRLFGRIASARYRWAICALGVVASVGLLPHMQQRGNRELVDAVNALDPTNVERLLNQGADPNSRLDAIRTSAEGDSLIARLKSRFWPKKGNAVLLSVIVDLRTRKNVDDPHDAIFESLLNHGADPSTTDTRFGWSALKRACQFGRTKYVDELLRRGALRRSTDADVAACLANLFADSSPSLDVATTSLLLTYGANPNARFADGSTALMFSWSPEKLDLLLRHGADPYLVNNNGNDTLGYMKSCALGKEAGLVPASEYKRLVRYLNSRGIYR